MLGPIVTHRAEAMWFWTLLLGRLEYPVFLALGGRKGPCVFDRGTPKHILLPAKTLLSEPCRERDDDFHQANTIMGGGQGIRVHARSLDSILSPFRLGHIDFLKMNIEGAEALAIPGMLETIRKTSDVAIQCHDFVGQCTKERIMEFLRLNGFQVETRRDTNRPYIRDTVYGSKAPCSPNVN